MMIEQSQDIGTQEQKPRAPERAAWEQPRLQRLKAAEAEGISINAADHGSLFS